MTEITKATFEKEGKIDGQLTLKEKKFLRDNITSLHEGKASKANAPYYLVEPSQDIGIPYNLNQRNRAPDILVPDTFSKFERDFAIKDVLTSLKDVHTVAEITSRIGNSTEKAALLQTYLVAKGLLTAPQGETYAIDGIVGNATLTAIKNYRKNEAPRQEQATQAKAQREQNEKLSKKLEAGWNPSLEQIEDNAKGKGYSLDKTASKDPNVVLKKSAKITIKTQDGETVDESTSSQQLSIKINLNQFYDRKLNQSAFDAEINKQFTAALNKEQTAQDKKNAEAVQNANTLKIKNERERTLASNKEKALNAIKAQKLHITEKALSSFPSELSAYNSDYPYHQLNKSQLSNAFINKFEDKQLSFRKVKTEGNHLVFSLDSTKDEPYMQDFKIPLNTILDGNNNLIKDKFVQESSNKMREAFTTYVKLAVKQQQENREKEKTKQNEQLASI